MEAWCQFHERLNPQTALTKSNRSTGIPQFGKVHETKKNKDVPLLIKSFEIWPTDYH